MHRDECITPEAGQEESSTTQSSAVGTQQQILPPGDISSILEALDDTFVGTGAAGIPNVQIDGGRSDGLQGDQIIVEPSAPQVDEAVVHEAVTEGSAHTEAAKLSESSQEDFTMPDVRPAALDGGADGRRRHLEQDETKNEELETQIEQAKQRMKQAKKEIEQAEKLMEVKKRKAKEEDDEKTGEPPIKMFKHGHADEYDDVVEDEQSEITKSDEDDGVENFLDALQGFDRTAGRDKNGLCLTCEF